MPVPARPPVLRGGTHVVSVAPRPAQSPETTQPAAAPWLPSNSSIQWAGPFPKNDWEREAGQIIVAGLDGLAGRLLSGLKVPLYKGRKRKGQIEIDHVLVAEVGLFAIECKNCGARITGTLNGAWHRQAAGGSELIESAGRENPSDQVLEQVYALKNILVSGLGKTDDLVKSDRLWIYATVLFPDSAEFHIDHVTANAFNDNAAVVFNVTRFVAALSERTPHKRYSPSELERIASVLTRI
jgi:hypothetical protein